MNKLIKYLDFGSALMVLISIFYVNSYPIFWLSYGLACFVYVFINWKKGLFGQSIMNIIAGLIAIKNFLI